MWYKIGATYVCTAMFIAMVMCLIDVCIYDFQLSFLYHATMLIIWISPIPLVIANILITVWKGK